MTELIKRNNTNVKMGTIEVLDKLLKYAEVFAESNIVPKHYRGNKGSILIALQTAHRMNLDPMMVMQGTYEIHGKLGMTSAFAIALANVSGIITGGIRYRIEGKNEALRVTAYTNLKSNGEEISYEIGMKEARAEGWTSNSKYTSMPELMLRYRAATLLIRTHLPEVINGMHMTDEIEDVQAARTVKTVDNVNNSPKTAQGLLDSFIEVENIEEQVVGGDDDEEEDKIAAKEIERIMPSVQCQELQGLIVEHNIPEETIAKWCDKGGAATIEELDEDKVLSCIEYIVKRHATDSEIISEH